jgi:aminopeptidase YwaD
MTRFGTLVVAAAVLAGLVACSDDADRTTSAPTRSASPSGSASPNATSTPAAPSATPTDAPPAVAPAVSPGSVRPATAMQAVRHLAGRVGPRPGTSPAYFEAAAWAGARLTTLGWDVRRQPFRTPSGVSWGVPVPGGRSVNLVATRGDVAPGRPWLAVGAHLDTVPQAPGAEDNASGVGVLLTVAEALRGTRSRLPVVLVAFGSEEPRGPGDDDHHFGSRAFVADLSPAQRRSLRGMVSLDRVGVGPVVPHRVGVRRPAGPAYPSRR